MGVRERFLSLRRASVLVVLELVLAAFALATYLGWHSAGVVGLIVAMGLVAALLYVQGRRIDALEAWLDERGRKL